MKLQASPLSTEKDHRFSGPKSVFKDDFFGSAPDRPVFRLDLFEGKMILEWNVLHNNGPLTGGFRDANPNHYTTTYPTGTRMGLLRLYLNSPNISGISIGGTHVYKLYGYGLCKRTPPKKTSIIRFSTSMLGRKF